MKKAVAILENNVQWITLALGGGFVVFMAYRYVLNGPSATIGGTTLSAGQIDQHIRETAGSALETKLGSGGTLELAPPPFDKDFQQVITSPVGSEPLSSPWTDARPLDIELPKSAKMRPGGYEGPKVAMNAELPAARAVGTSGGLSSINPNVLGGNPAAPQSPGVD